MCDTENSVDYYVAINETIHAWMFEPQSEAPSRCFTLDYDCVRLMQARCDELDWKLEYQRRAPNENDTNKEFIARVRPSKIDGNGQRLRRIDREASTLPLAICLVVVAAIEELKSGPSHSLGVKYGADGFVRRAGNVASIASRCVDEKEGGDGVTFHGTGSVHLTSPNQLRRIADWLRNAANGLEQLKERKDAR